MLNKRISVCLTLFIIILVGLFFRLSYIKHPDFIDEVRNVDLVLHLESNHFNPGRFWEPGLIFYSFYLLFKILKISSNHILIARFFIVFLSVVTIFFFYYFLEEYFNYKIALISTLFLSLNPLHIALSRYAISYIIEVFFILLAFIYIFKIFQSRGYGKRNYLIAGLFIGLAVATKYLGILLFFPLIIAHYFQKQKQKKIKLLPIYDKYLYLSIFIAIAAFLIINPFAIFDSNKFFNDWAGIYRRTVYSFPYAALTNKRGWFSFPVSLFYALGPGLYLLSLGGILLRIIKRKNKEILLLSLIVSFYFIIGFFRFSFTRLLILIVPFALIFAAEFLLVVSNFIINKIARLRQERTMVIFCLSLCFTIPSIPGIIFYGKWISQEPTEKIAAKWCYKNILPNSYLLIDAYGENLNILFDNGNIYKIRTINWEKSIEPNLFFKENSFDYVIIDSSRARPARMEPFYTYIEKHFILIKELRPFLPTPKYKFDSLYSSTSRSNNPTIKIYKLNN